MKFAVLVLAAFLFPSTSLAQPAPKEGERAPRPENASNARVGGWCDALTGQKKEQCLRDERRKAKLKRKVETKEKKARPKPAVQAAH